MHDQLKAVSISYKNAPLAIREQIALNEDGCKALLVKLQEVIGIGEAIVLSTCNRTEIYYCSAQDQAASVIKLLAAMNGLASEQIAPYFVCLSTQAEAINYLFEVALGLHSQVVGDVQLPNQIKHAYQWSADMQMSGPFMHRLLHTIFFVNKRLVQETAFRDGAASTSYATVEALETFLPLLPNARILLVGLGEMGRDVALTLADKGYTNIYLTNRTRSKAEALAEQLHFGVVDFDEVENEILLADVVISSVRMEQPLVTPALLSRRAKRTVQYFIDLSVPRSIDPSLDERSGVVVYDLDEIQQRANAALEMRVAAIPQVKALIAEAIEEFNDWSKEMMVSPTIHKLKGALEQIRQEEMARYMKTLSEDEYRKMEKITSSMMQKIIKLPVLQLKAACKRGEAETLIDVLNDLFNLEAATAATKH